MDQPLDAEDQSSYTFTVTVSDGLITDQAFVTININDVNDETPGFNGENGTLPFSVPETSPVDYIVHTLVGSDADRDPPNNEFMMVIESGNDEGKFKLEVK